MLRLDVGIGLLELNWNVIPNQLGIEMDYNFNSAVWLYRVLLVGISGGHNSIFLFGCRKH